MRGGFEYILNLNLSRFTPAAAKEIHIKIAKESVGAFLLRQENKPGYTIFTDGVESYSEDSVRPYGVIRYVFQRLEHVGKLAIKTARNLSPVRSGRYKKSWLLLADKVAVDEGSIPSGTKELILVNPQPYARKIHTRGARLVKPSVQPGIIERVRQIVLKEHRKSIEVNIKYIELSNAYVLKAGIKGRGVLTYPALVMKPKY